MQSSKTLNQMLLLLPLSRKPVGLVCKGGVVS
jgi:hypothetical protein